MTTEDVVRGYFSDLKQRKCWESHVADGIEFTSYASPIKQVTSRAAFVQATKRFYSMIESVEVRDLLVDGEKACALTRYELRPPNGGASFKSDVAELFSVRDGKVASFGIYFDTAPYPNASGVTLAIVRAYHNAWTSKQFDKAVYMLAADLQVEVPVNEYPTKESFAAALIGFGGLVRGVTLLAEFARENTAMLLYDMDVEQLGVMRIAEHFTVADGRITRLRQIHDTAAVRAAGFAENAVGSSAEPLSGDRPLLAGRDCAKRRR